MLCSSRSSHFSCNGASTTICFFLLTLQSEGYSPRRLFMSHAAPTQVGRTWGTEADQLFQMTQIAMSSGQGKGAGSVPNPTPIVTTTLAQTQFST